MATALEPPAPKCDGSPPPGELDERGKGSLLDFVDRTVTSSSRHDRCYTADDASARRLARELGGWDWVKWKSSRPKTLFLTTWSSFGPPKSW